MTTVTFSFVREPGLASPEAAAAHFAGKLALECDPSDLATDLTRGVPGLVVVDARSPAAYAACRIPGAINLPHRTITEATTASLDRDALYVVYCAGIGCNASTKGALRLSRLGFQVKELVGGLRWWRKEGNPVDGTEGAGAPYFT